MRRGWPQDFKARKSRERQLLLPILFAPRHHGDAHAKGKTRRFSPDESVGNI